MRAREKNDRRSVGTLGDYVNRARDNGSHSRSTNVTRPCLGTGVQPSAAAAHRTRQPVNKPWLSAFGPTIRLVMRASTKVYVAVGVASGLAAYLLGVGVPWSLVIASVSPLLIAAAPRFLLATVRGALTPSPKESPAALAMSGMEFEDYVARIARTCGVPVIMTAVTGDWGVDLIVGHRPDRLAVQCKRQSRPVGAGAVQEVVAGAPMHGLHEDDGRHQPRIHARRSANSRSCTAASSSADRSYRGYVRSSAGSPSRRHRRPSSAGRPARPRRPRRSRHTTPSARAGTGRCRRRWPA